ncbi:MAG: glutathione peroxidase [Rickettsiaceae bacterium]|nr:glutathione peroxidase [Rickettsiaceae bacterium]
MKNLQILLIIVINILLCSMSIYDISFENSKTGEKINLADHKGKVIMLVNTASNCGFTRQYASMQKLWDEYKDQNFLLIAIPTNDFGGQEPGSNAEIVEFCEINFGINFPIAKKVTSKGENIHPFFLLVKQDFGSQAGPSWNFYKYLYGPDGKPLEWYSFMRSGNSNAIKKLIDKHLKLNSK